MRSREERRAADSASRTICGADEPEAPLRAAYKALGYRLGSTEPLMVHSLAQIPAVAAPFSMEEVRTQEIADRLAKAAGRRQVLPEHFAPDSPLPSTSL